MVATWLLTATPTHDSWPISLYLIVGALISALSLLAVGETLRRHPTP
ncbi:MULTISPECIES: hypothetical protein [Saccharothrix]|nr:hypothetical protein [Saccharothrix sp. CB00851]